MFAVPGEIAVTRPEDDTDTMAASEVAHVIVLPAIVAPFWSLTLAESCAVFPIASNVTLVDDNTYKTHACPESCEFEDWQPLFEVVDQRTPPWTRHP